jgi:hypothetical protein
VTVSRNAWDHHTIAFAQYSTVRARPLEPQRIGSARCADQLFSIVESMLATAEDALGWLHC